MSTRIAEILEIKNINIVDQYSDDSLYGDHYGDRYGDHYSDRYGDHGR